MPWNPSITWGPEVPSPSTNRPPVSASQLAAVMAIAAALREKTFRMVVAISTRSVMAAR